jgi:type I restriction enzyme R subunit
VIVDEAHSSQTGETARELKSILGANAQNGAQNGNGDDESDWEDRLNQIMASRGQQQNLSFFAFTATPKGKTLELFGRPGASGSRKPSTPIRCAKRLRRVSFSTCCATTRPTAPGSSS